jgi:hypothetical protein
VCAITSGKEVYMPIEWQRDLADDAHQNPTAGATFVLLERVQAR